MATTQSKRSFPRWLLWGGVIAVVVLGGGGFWAWRQSTTNVSAATLRTGAVTEVTAISSVTASGPVEALQQSSVFWGTTGRVAQVKVKIGDHIKAGEVLMELDPTTAPANVIGAQADLINAQKTLDDLFKPSDLAVANAQKAIVDAQDALTKAQKELRNAQNPVGTSLRTSVADAKLALDTAQANEQLATVSQDAQSLNTARANAVQARRRYEDAQAKLDTDSGNVRLAEAVNALKASAQNATDQVTQLELKISTDQANKADTTDKAQDKYNTAVTNLNNALRGPDATKVTQAQAKVAVAQASLADAQTKLDKLTKTPDANDVAVAQARLQSAQATANLLLIKAPFDGEVLAINYLPGDSVTQGTAAVVIANRNQLHVTIQVDEGEISQIRVGNPATLTIDSLADLALAGTVSKISPFGQTVQSLVKYNVQVEMAQIDPNVLLGMTANVQVVTKVQTGALAVPLDAVQLDQEGEFVTRVTAGALKERVNVVSGEVQEETVIIVGELKPGDTVELISPQPTNNGSPFGG